MDEFSVHNKIILKGNHITIPTSMRQSMLDQIHEPQLGIIKSKQLARDFIFWPGLGKQIEDKIARCPAPYVSHFGIFQIMNLL